MNLPTFSLKLSLEMISMIYNFNDLLKKCRSVYQIRLTLEKRSKLEKVL